MSLRGQDVLRTSSRAAGRFVCWRCQQKRSITRAVEVRKAYAEQLWKDYGKEIREGKKQSVLEQLERRGLVHQIAGERHALEKLIIDKRVGFYCGIDPTAPSLHVGHIIPLMALFWTFLHGCTAVSLVGGATAKIGDPSLRTQNRESVSRTEQKANLASIHYQLKRIWLNVESMAARHGYTWERHWRRAINNNATWWNNKPLLEVLKLLGTGMRMGPMLGKENVKTKLDSPSGMSFAEFVYPIMQAWDWWELYNKLDVQIQIGGSDQYGNIVTGVEAIKYIRKTHPDPDIRWAEGAKTDLETPYGFTVPLLTTSSGEKIGKSAGNAIWLDSSMTSIFDLYGYFVRTADADVERYLKYFTFLSLPKIQGIMVQHNADPSKRIAQHTLAYEFCELAHGKAEARNAKAQHERIFKKPTVSSVLADVHLGLPTAAAPEAASPTGATSSDVAYITENRTERPNPYTENQNQFAAQKAGMQSTAINQYAPQTNHTNMPSTHLILPKSLIYGQPISRVLYAATLVNSRSEGHRIVQAGGAYIGRRSSDKEQMGDDLSFVPAKLRDPWQTWEYVIRDDESGAMEKPGEEGLLILRVGKWKVKIVRIVADELYDTLDVEPSPAWREFKAQQIAEKAQEAEAEAASKEAAFGAEDELPEELEEGLLDKDEPKLVGKKSLLESIRAEDREDKPVARNKRAAKKNGASGERRKNAREVRGGRDRVDGAQGGGMESLLKSVKSEQQANKPSRQKNGAQKQASASNEYRRKAAARGNDMHQRREDDDWLSPRKPSRRERQHAMHNSVKKGKAFFASQD